MRQSTHETRILRTQDDVLGIALGFDFCGEHHEGIPDIYRAFGISPKADDIWSCRPEVPLQDIAPCVQFRDYPRPTKLCPAETRLIISSDQEYLQRILIPRHSRSWSLPIQIGNSGLAVAWNSRGIFIRCFSEETRDALKTVHAHLLQGDVLLAPGLGNPNTRGGINILIASRYKAPKSS